MSGSAWGIVWLAIALKVPIVALLWLVWWAIKDPPVPEPEDGGGGSPDRDPHPHPRRRPPQPPAPWPARRTGAARASARSGRIADAAAHPSVAFGAWKASTSPEARSPSGR